MAGTITWRQTGAAQRSGLSLGEAARGAAQTIAWKIRNSNPWAVVLFAVAASELLTATMNTVMGILWWGAFSLDLVLIGSVDAFVVSSIVAVIVVFSIQSDPGDMRRGEGLAGKASLHGQSREVDVALIDEPAGTSAAFLHTVFHSIRDPFCIIDSSFRIVKANQAYGDLRNLPMDSLIGKQCHRALLDREEVCPSCVVQKTFRSGDPCAKEKFIPLSHGAPSWGEIYTYPVRGSGGKVTHVIQYIRDVTERKRADEEKYRLIERLEILSSTDGLTGLFNRRAVFERLSAEAARSQRYGSALSLILCDVDQFKKINDTYGHIAGDRVLQHVADIIRSLVRKTDVVARYGGDEFIIILPETPLSHAVTLAERIQAMIEASTIDVPGSGGISSSLSFGVSDLGPQPDDVHKVVRNADDALYDAKRSGRNRVSVRSRKWEAEGNPDATS